MQLYTDFKLSKELVRITGFTANDTLAGVDNTVGVSKRDVSNASRALKEPSVPSTPSRNLCEEVRLSSDHRQVVELQLMLNHAHKPRASHFTVTSYKSPALSYLLFRAARLC